MILCGLDLETTGLEPDKSEITEIGFAIFDTDHWDKPLAMESQLCLIEGEVPQEIMELTGITKALLDKAGRSLATAYQSLVEACALFKVNYIVAHNGAFDKNFLDYHAAKLKLPLMPQPWIDTKKDIEFPKKIRNTNLVALAAEHGFLNPFPHAALFDVFTMMKILSKYNIDDVISYKNEPAYFLAAQVDYNNRTLASKRGYKWQECEGKTFDKTWVKAVKARHIEKERSDAPFTLKILGEVK